MSLPKKKLLGLSLIICLLVVFITASWGHAASIELSDSSLDGVQAKDGSISIGSFDLTDNHQYDASQYKGAIQMDGNVQQNVTAEVNLNQTQGAAAFGLNIIGNITTTSNQTINQVNSNTATSFIGGF